MCHPRFQKNGQIFQCKLISISFSTITYGRKNTTSCQNEFNEKSFFEHNKFEEIEGTEILSTPILLNKNKRLAFNFIMCNNFLGPQKYSLTVMVD